MYFFSPKSSFYILFFSILFVPLFILAQDDVSKFARSNLLTLSYSPSVSIKDTENETINISYIGAGAGLRLKLKPNISIGPGIMWRLFETKKKQTRFQTQRFDLEFLANYYFLHRRNVYPTIGLSAGATKIVETAFGEIQTQRNALWRPTLGADIGALAQGRNIPFLLRIGYIRTLSKDTRWVENIIRLEIGVCLPL